MESARRFPIDRMCRLVAWLATAFLILSISGCGGGSASPGESVPPSTVVVPNVVGQSQAAASAAITAAGLTVGTVTMQSSSTVAAGDVISQSPATGASVTSGSAVNLVVSSGPAQISVPNVVGLTQAAATTAITAAGLTVGTVTMQSSSSVAAGDVISQSPAAGASVASGSAVNLVVSSGPATYAVSVTVSGLASGQSLTVQDNGADSLTFQNNTTQQFAILLALNTTYSVTVSVQPMLEACTVAGGSGPVTGPVAVSVSCSLAPPSTSYPAFTAPYPLVLSGQTPAVIVPSPRIVPVFFSNSPDQAATEAYLQALVASPEWTALAEYGVGQATVGTPVSLTSAAPATTTTAGINSYVAANAASWGTLDGSEIFVLYYPPATTITDDTDSYHYWTTSTTSQQVPYAVLPNYSLANGYIQYHEIAEASTDPIPGEGYVVLNHDATAWSFAGTELADMCTRFSGFFDSSLGYLMEGIWSDAAVKNGQAPCTTAGSTNLGYGFGAYPVLPDTYLGSSSPGDTNASVGIAPGASVTIPINFFSYGPVTSPIAIRVVQQNTNAANTNTSTFSLDQNSGLNGSVAHLTITAPATPLSATTNYASFLVYATMPAANNNGPESAFPGLVTNPGASCSTKLVGSSSSVESVLYGFTGGADGATPLAGLVQGSDGNFYGTTYAGGDSNHGTIFKITPTGTLTTLHSFIGTDGASPDANLVQGGDGNFYGTTGNGGITSSNGTVFKITPSGTLTTLYFFSGTDGSGPNGLVLDSDGNYYSTAFGGGSSNDGTVFKITPTGTLTTLYSFSGADGLNPRAGLALGSDGNFYGTTRSGGTGNDGTVFKITPSGTLTMLHSFSGIDGLDPWSSALVQGSDGNFYGTTVNGGALNNGTVFQITPTGMLTTLYSFTGGVDGSGPDGSLVQGSDGNVYGTTAGGGGCGPGAVFKISVGN